MNDERRTGIASLLPVRDDDEVDLLRRAWDALERRHGATGAAWRFAVAARLVLEEAAGKRAAVAAWKAVDRARRIAKARAPEPSAEAPKRPRGRPRGSTKPVTPLVAGMKVAQRILAKRGQRASRTAAAKLVGDAAMKAEPGIYGESSDGIAKRLLNETKPPARLGRKMPRTRKSR